MYLRFACECKPGYILDDIFGKCVPLEECKSTDLPTEATTQTSGKTETSRTTETSEKAGMTEMIPTEATIHISGTTETSEKTEMSATTKIPETKEPIVPEESKCQKNEVFVECSKKCSEYCHIPVLDGCEFLGPCFPLCECKEGYARNIKGECVLEEECLSVPCNGPNEIGQLRGLKNECCPTCEHRNGTSTVRFVNESSVAKELCDEPMYLSFACGCKPGYILNDVYGKCVPIEECKAAGMFPVLPQQSDRSVGDITHGKLDFLKNRIL
ncbi:hypothetical protein ANCDUO_10821 [Ancylostoma duodenale]|uniref:TIL domain-containing protein n=1 Tax=Ancylostoma duodenale TaxID=51022 RepID=A0A0C2CQD4_9BILA|nr:hypothetical protein ANCDUO_10821 [Ancylostoma duodenale]